jgi:signal peptidase I
MWTVWLKHVRANRASGLAKSLRLRSTGGKLRFPAVVKVLSALALCLLSYLFFSRYVMTTVEVIGVSMYPTLHAGERFLLDRTWYHYHTPQRGDLVVIRDPSHADCAVKRIVALPGERVRMQRNIVYVNGRRLLEPYLPNGTLATEDAVLEKVIRIPEQCYFVLGDNRSNSEDSRHYGAVPGRSILGALRLSQHSSALPSLAAWGYTANARSLSLCTISCSTAEEARTETKIRASE